MGRFICILDGQAHFYWRTIATMWKSPPYNALKKSAGKSFMSMPLLGMLLKQFVQFWPQYSAAFFMLWATNWAQSFLPFWAQKITEKIATQATWHDTLALAGLAVAIFFSRTFSRLFFFYPARVLERDMKMQLVEKLEITPPNRYAERTSGDLYQIICNDIEQVRALIGFALLQIGNMAIALLVLLPKLFAFEPKLLWALIPVAVSFALFTWIVGSTRHHFTRNMELQSVVQNQIIEAYNGKSTIKNFHREQTFENIFRAKSAEELMSFYKSGVGIGWSLPLIPLGIGISLLWGAMIIQELQLGASSLILFSGFIYLLMEPLGFLSWIGVVFASGIAAWKRIRTLSQELNEPVKNEQISNIGQFPEFNYFNKQQVLPFLQNNWTAYVADTGHGKTVAMEHLALWFGQQGHQVAYVAQSPYLFNDSIEQNLFLQGPEFASAESIEAAIQLLSIFGLDDLGTQSLKLEVGEHGRRLSGGQVKRVCLIRSILSQATHLIWDDPFSSIDVINERDILQKLRRHPLMQNRTLILTSHRLTTVRYCDRIVYIHKERGIGALLDKGVLADPRSEVYEHFQKQMV
jgi:ATP-binding cassette subfamily B multidrug efflux pump